MCTWSRGCKCIPGCVNAPDWHRGLRSSRLWVRGRHGVLVCNPSQTSGSISSCGLSVQPRPPASKSAWPCWGLDVRGQLSSASRTLGGSHPGAPLGGRRRAGAGRPSLRLCGSCPPWPHPDNGLWLGPGPACELPTRPEAASPEDTTMGRHHPSLPRSGHQPQQRPAGLQPLPSVPPAGGWEPLMTSRGWSSQGPHRPLSTPRNLFKQLLILNYFCYNNECHFSILDWTFD